MAPIDDKIVMGGSLSVALLSDISGHARQGVGGPDFPCRSTLVVNSGDLTVVMIGGL